MLTLTSPPPSYGGEKGEQGEDDDDEEGEEEEEEEEEEGEEEQEEEGEEEIPVEECELVSGLDDINGEVWGTHQVVQYYAQGQGLVTEPGLVPNQFSEEFHAAKEEYRKYMAHEGTSSSSVLVQVSFSDFFVPHEANVMIGGNGGEEENEGKSSGLSLCDGDEEMVDMSTGMLARGRGLDRVSARGQGLDEQRLQHLHAARALEMRALEALERYIKHHTPIVVYPPVYLSMKPVSNDNNTLPMTLIIKATPPV